MYTLKAEEQRGPGESPVSIFAEYVPLESQSPYSIIVYSGLFCDQL